MINFLTKCSFFLYGYSTIHFAFLIADTHCFDLNYLDNIFLKVFCISYCRQIFLLVLVDVVFDYNHLHSLFFRKIFVIPYCAPVLVIVLIRGIMLVS